MTILLDVLNSLALKPLSFPNLYREIVEEEVWMTVLLLHWVAATRTHAAPMGVYVNLHMVLIWIECTGGPRRLPLLLYCIV